MLVSNSEEVEVDENVNTKKYKKLQNMCGILVSCSALYLYGQAVIFGAHMFIVTAL